MEPIRIGITSVRERNASVPRYGGRIKIKGLAELSCLLLAAPDEKKYQDDSD